MRQLILCILILSCGFGVAAQPARGNWIPTMHAPATILSVGWTTVILDDGSILGLGNSSGGDANSKAYRYDFKTNDWTQTGPLPVDVVGLKPVKVLNGKVMALGVFLKTQRPVALIFDPATMQWALTGAVPADNLRFGAKVLSLSNGNALVLGLSDKKYGGWIYDYQTNSWSLTEPMPIEIKDFSYATNLKEGSVLVVANDRSLQGKWVGFLYDPKNDSWTSTGTLPVVMGSSPSGFATLKDETILLIGYRQSPYVGMAAVVYHPDSKTWTQTDEIPNELLSVGAARQLPNGLVITSASESMGKGVFSPLFNPATNKWITGTKLSSDYQGLAILGTQPDGMVWGMGYRYGSGTDELVYSSVLKKWTKVGAMPEEIIGIQNTGQADGSVLIFIKTRSGLDVKTDAVLFTP